MPLDANETLHVSSFCLSLCLSPSGSYSLSVYLKTLLPPSIKVCTFHTLPPHFCLLPSSLRVRSSDFSKLDSQTWITNQNAVTNKVTAGKRSSDFPLTLILAHFEPSHCASHCAAWPRKYRSTSARAFRNCLRPTVDCWLEHRSQ